MKIAGIVKLEMINWLDRKTVQYYPNGGMHSIPFLDTIILVTASAALSILWVISGVVKAKFR